MIDTVTFDLWNTLLSNKPQDNERYKLKRLEAIHVLLKSKGFGVNFRSLYRAHEEGYEKCKETWNKNLDLSTQEQLKIMFTFLDNPRLSAFPQSLMPELEEVFLAPILKDPPPLIRGAKKTIDYVRAEGYKIGLICNTGRTPGRMIRKLLEKLDLIRYFGALSFSNELKRRKPDQRIFFHTLSQLESSPAKAMHVGDELRTDILGARRAGMVSVHFKPNQSSFAESQSQDTDLVPDFSIDELTELEIILRKTK